MAEFEKRSYRSPRQFGEEFRYCSYFHAREALLAGISEAEVESLLGGVVDHCPEEEAAAILYAQHWRCG